MVTVYHSNESDGIISCVSRCEEHKIGGARFSETVVHGLAMKVRWHAGHACMHHRVGAMVVSGAVDGCHAMILHNHWGSRHVGGCHASTHHQLSSTNEPFSSAECALALRFDLGPC